MGKKILKRSLVLGAMMAFVITGNVWAIDLPTGSETDKVSNTELVQAGLVKLNNIRFVGEQGDHVANIKIQTIGEFYRDGNLQLWTGFNNTSRGTVNDCCFEINNKMSFSGYLELTGAHIASSNEQKAINNTINIKNAIVESKSALGFYSGLANSGAVNSVLKKNELRICNSTLTYNCNGYLHLYGGANNAGSAIKNTVDIDNLYINGYDESDFTGSSQNSKTIICGGEAEDIAESNIVIIKNTDLSEVSVYGGKVASGDAKKNEVHFSNVIINDSKIYGGYVEDVGVVSGNRLYLGEDVLGTAKLISGFNEIYFKDLKWNPNGSVIKTASLELGDENNKTVVNVNGLSKDGDPKKGEVMTLIDKTGTDEVKGYFEESKSVFNSGNFIKAEGKVYQEDDDIKLKITRVGTNDQAVVIGESRAAATAFTNQGSELIEIGLDSLARDKSERETKVFASVFGNASEYKTGSHVKVNGWSGIVGVAKTNDDGLTTGAFFENGEGNYRTYNVFEGDFMRGDGEACYNGGGLLVRKDNDNGVYTEASLRAGNLQNELRKAVIGSDGLAGYDIDTFYYGAHVGVGKIIPRGNEGDSIDVYGKFIYTHHDSEDFSIGKDKFHFDSVDSERLRLGFRINEVQNNKLTMYYGAAWEYEFGGDADNTVVGYDLSTPSLGGSTVIGELGAHYKADAKWSFDLNVRGYGGQRDGFTGSVQANYLF